MDNSKPASPSPSISTTSPNYMDSAEFSQNSGENNSSSSISRATKNWRKIKDFSEKEDKRPPWKIVSVSTLPQADVNSILRAKLLDASRRVRSGKIPVGVQTDIIPAKLLKEVNIDIQCDLIEMRDAANLTDGTITLKADGPVILTYSVSQMTDEKPTENAQTQTATPMTSHKFFDEYFNEEILNRNIDDFKEMDFTKNEMKLLNQIKEIRYLDKKLKNNSLNLNKINENENANSSDISLDSLSQESDNTENEITMFTRKSSSNSKFKNDINSTESLWSFDFDDEIYNRNRSYSVPNRKLVINNFDRFVDTKNSMLLKKTRNMKLLPNSERKSLVLKQEIYSWSIEQRTAIYELLNGTIALLNVFKEMSIMLGPDIKLNELPKEEKIDIYYLSDYWNPILHDSARILDQKLASLKHIQPKLVKTLDISFLEKIS